MSETPPPLEGTGSTAVKNEEVAKVKTEYEAPSKQFKEALESYKKKMEGASIKLEGIESAKTVAALSKQQEGEVVSLSYVENAFWRDFKILGVIGGEKQKDRLSFVSPIRQIDAGLERGCKEREIIDAVIREVSPSLKLRSYLETPQDFLMRALDLRQLILFAPQAESSARNMSPRWLTPYSFM